MTRYPIPAVLDRDALAEAANARHDRNFNCAQSVACTLGVELGADEDICFRLTEGLGGGLATHTETCGALLGGAAVLGLANSNGCADPTSKQATYALDKVLVARFRERFGTCVCSELRAQDDSGKTPLPVCVACIKEAIRMTADILEDLAAEQKK